MIFNMMGGGGTAGSGSGAGLNFKIVGGTTQPANPSENTIWVNTDADITGWMFSAKTPFIGEIANSANTVLGTVNTSALNNTGRTLKKKNDGKAVTTLYSCSSSIGTVIVSPNREACTILSIPLITTTGATTVTAEANDSFVYNGETYYYAYVSFDNFVYSFGSDEKPVFCDSIVELAKALAFMYDCDGNVWIHTDVYSCVEFNALKKNGIKVYPLRAKQHVNGELINVECMSYLNGEWVEWVPEGALYWLGNECVDITGGWTSKAWKMQSDAGGTSSDETFTITRNPDNLTFTKTGLYGAVMHTVNKIDLTNAKAIHFKGEMYAGGTNYYWARFCVWSSITGSFWSTNAVAVQNGVVGEVVKEFSLDVSSLDGTYYVGFGIYSGNDEYEKNNYVKVEELYLEVEE